MSPVARWRVADLAWVPLDRTTTLTTPRQGRGVVALPAALARVLRGMTSFRPIEEHVARATQESSLSPAQQTALADDLRRLAASGVLTSLERVCATAATGERSSPGPVRTVAIVTRDRPELVRRAILGRHAAEAGRDVTYAVFDDAREASGRARLRAEVESLAPLGPKVRYVGIDEKRAFIEALAKHPSLGSVDASLLAFGMIGEREMATQGANRNAARLMLDGPLGFTDDDITGLSARMTDVRPGLVVTSRHDATTMRLFATPDDAISAVAPSLRPVLEEHENWLGQSVGACFGRADGPLDLDEATLFLTSTIASAYVAVTTNGLVGDSGMGSPGHYLLLHGESRASLLANYEVHRRTRALLRGSTCTTLSEGAFFMSYAFCLDDRECLPPFFPMQRNADGIFGAMLRQLHPSALVAHLPSVVEHRPLETRSFANGPSNQAAVSLPDILNWVIHAWSFAPTDVTALRRDAFVRHLRGLGALTPSAFEDFLRHRRLAHLGKLSQLLEAQGDRYRDSVGFTADIDAELRAIREVATNLSRTVPGDVAAPSPDEVVIRTQRLLHRFGDLVEAWPTIAIAASEVRAP